MIYELFEEYVTCRKEMYKQNTIMSFTMADNIRLLFWGVCSYIGMIYVINDRMVGAWIIIVETLLLLVEDSLADMFIPERKIRTIELKKYNAEQRQEIVVSLLKKYKINYMDRQVLAKLIEHVKKKQKRFDVWNKLKNPFGVSISLGMLFFNVFLQVFADEQMLLVCVMVVSLVFGGIMFLMVVIRFVELLFETRASFYDEFIQDLEEIGLLALTYEE